MTDRTDPRRPDVACFYFPAWHADARNDVWKEPGFTEWKLVDEARPRFDGHRQPLRPSWGYVDESDPEVMQRGCAAAAGAGIDAFLFDWYRYDGEDFLHGALHRGYLALPDPGVAFALHWANHDWVDVFPARTHTEATLLSPARVSAEEFGALADLVIERYMQRETYWRVRGGAWFSWHQFGLFVEWMGGWEATRDVLADFRERARRAGVGELHLAAVGGIDLTAGDGARLAEVGIDSLTPYNWLHVLPLDRGLSVDYADWHHLAQDDAERWAGLSSVPFAPNVTMGWDSTARVHQDDPLEISTWPRLPVVVDNTPERFSAACADMLERARGTGAGYLTVNAWNEWTEGSYLEPEETTGDGHLEALRTAVASTSTPASRT
ncbi:glycoside hydrolase family 99-like domain-containing protein [Desertihabitans aurantiacus]|uniref:glycoside hydrolase family 99-like domain-containing protein n=1 Tax=Desertihabitans aurantiacus TaxID=2282477 RepID=UPI0013004271|nr:glycoside hydrolase family 99-like domain-containing protein [Desertihabitans aurantiacus]